MKKNFNKKSALKKKSKTARPFKITGKREKELQELKRKTEELEKSRIALMNILEDVEEARKDADEERNKTLAIITNFTDGLLVFNEKSNLSLINPQAEEFFEIKAENIAGKSISDLSAFSSFKPLTAFLEKGIKEVFRKELKLKEELTLEVSTVIILRKKERLGTLVILHNITREKMIERMKTEFVSIVAHQLRTPLSAIKWTLKMLLDEDLGKITEEQRGFIKKSYVSNERMITLINDLLNVTRIEEGRFLYKPAPTQIENVIQFVIDSYKRGLQKKKITLEFKKPKKKLPQVVIDVEKMNLAIQNLIDNAIRYTPVGGKVTISVNRDKKKIEFSIRDTGMGIPKNQQKRVFTKFFRAPNVMKVDTVGSGLGLFITRNIIKSHGGEIWFESEQGKGTTFYFTLSAKQ